MLHGRPVSTALAAIVLAALLSLPARAQVDGETETPGNSCPPNAVPGHAATPSWDTFFECNSSSQWQRGPYFFGSISDTCDSNHEGMVQWNASILNLQVCDGTAWQAIGNTSNSCGSVSGLSFTNVSNASLNTVYTSNAATITFSGCSGALSVSVTGAATAQISVNGGAWTTSGSIYSGQTLQVRLTASGSVNTTLTATVDVGPSASTNWQVTTGTGGSKVFLTNGTYIGGQIGGLSGADVICQSEANSASLSGTYKAIMSDDSTSAASRLTINYPVVNANNGSTVAATNLWVGSISACIEQPNGGCPDFGVSTGTNADGSSATGYTCSSWSSESASNNTGRDSETNADWITGDIYGASCSGSYYIYCIQQ